MRRRQAAAARHQVDLVLFQHAETHRSLTEILRPFWYRSTSSTASECAASKQCSPERGCRNRVHAGCTRILRARTLGANAGRVQFISRDGRRIRRIRVRSYELYEDALCVTASTTTDLMGRYSVHTCKALPTGLRQGCDRQAYQLIHDVANFTIKYEYTARMAHACKHHFARSVHLYASAHMNPLQRGMFMVHAAIT
jgi:hypothetical protein